MNKPFKTEIPLRGPDEIMKLDRMGSMFPSRMSFMRTLIRNLSRKAAIINRTLWEMDTEGFGRAVYSVTIGKDIYSLVAFSNKLDPSNRTDRVIAEA